MIVLKIDVTKIDKNHLFQGKSGKYLDAALQTIGPTTNTAMKGSSHPASPKEARKKKKAGRSLETGRTSVEHLSCKSKLKRSLPHQNLKPIHRRWGWISRFDLTPNQKEPNGTTG